MSTLSELDIAAPVEISIPITGREGVGSRPGLKRNALWIMGGNFTYAATQWLQVAVIAHLGTSTEVGHYALAMGISTPVFMLFNLQLRQIQATDSSSRHSFGDYLALRLTTCVGAMLTIAAACFFAGSTKLAFLIAAAGIFKGIESLSDVYQGLLQQRERMDLVGCSLMFKGLLMILAFCLTYLCSHTLVLAVLSMSIAQLLSLVLYDMPVTYRAIHGMRGLGFAVVHCESRLQWRSSGVRCLAIRALPLGITMMLSSLYVNVPRFVIDRYQGPAGVGIYAAISYLSMTGSLLVTAIGISISPRLSQLAQRDQVGFWLLLKKLGLLSVALGAGGVAMSVLFAPHLLRVMYGNDYAAQSQLLVWGMVAVGLGYVTSMLGYAATALGRFREQPWAVAIATGVLLAVSVVLVPRYGLTGAAVSTVAASFACLCAFSVIVSRGVLCQRLN